MSRSVIMWQNDNVPFSQKQYIYIFFSQCNIFGRNRKSHILYTSWNITSCMHKRVALSRSDEGNFVNGPTCRVIECSGSGRLSRLILTDNGELMPSHAFHDVISIITFLLKVTLRVVCFLLRSSLLIHDDLKIIVENRVHMQLTELCSFFCI